MHLFYEGNTAKRTEESVRLAIPRCGRGDHGTATVSFGLDRGGRLISARLVRGSGVASIDQEVQAMVRRASPFPAPPDGRPRSFTVPIAFRLN